MKCSYLIDESISPGAKPLAFEVKHEYIVHWFTNISCPGDLRMDNDQTRQMNYESGGNSVVVAPMYPESFCCKRSGLGRTFS